MVVGVLCVHRFSLCFGLVFWFGLFFGVCFVVV